VSGTPGTTTGIVVDNGDGSYSVSTTWDPEVTDEPSVVVLQPERLPVVLAPWRGHRTESTVPALAVGASVPSGLATADCRNRHRLARELSRAAH
jgi:hypothetical protein